MGLDIRDFVLGKYFLDLTQNTQVPTTTTTTENADK